MSFDKLLMSAVSAVEKEFYKRGIPLQPEIEDALRVLLMGKIGEIGEPTVADCGYFISDDGKISFGSNENVELTGCGVNDPMAFLMDNFPLFLSWALTKHLGVPYELKARLLEHGGLSREKASEWLEA